MKQLVQVDDPNGQTIQWQYNATGQRTNTLYPGGLQLQNQYDAAGRIIRQIDTTGHSIHYTRDAAGRLSTIEYPNGITRTNRYNPNGQIIEYHLSNSSSNILHRNLERNSLGYKTAESIEAGLEPIPTKGEEQQRAYTAADHNTISSIHPAPGEPIEQFERRSYARK